MGKYTGLAPDTLIKIFTCEMTLNKQTVKRHFDAFNLVLEFDDYLLPNWLASNFFTLHG
jgi:hypothetical protein